MRNVALAALAATMLCGSAQAVDTITFTLAAPIQSIGTAGGTLSYSGTVTAASSNAATIYLNGDSTNAATPLSIDDSGFFNNLFELAPGESFTGELFTVTVPGSTLPGTYTGNFDLLGGAVAYETSDLLASRTFAVQVTAVSGVPEAASWAMMVGGFALTGAAMRRRRTTVRFAGA